MKLLSLHSIALKSKTNSGTARGSDFNPLYTCEYYIGILTNSEDPVEMPHYGISSRSPLLDKTKTIFRDRNTILFGNYNMYNL